MEKLSPETRDLAQSQIERLRELFPECVTESENGLAVDFDALKQVLSSQIVEGPQERYRLDWPGKRAAAAMANQPTDKTLRPARDESVDFDRTQNLFIEGDNLEVLKLIQETYLGKVKMIYIDPPYNTGNDFIYRDDFKQVREEYEEGSGQRDGEGNRLVANLESSGRFHSDWLSMMYPRLKLAKNLLSDDGVIFISIDDGEIANLRRLCDEVFGVGNFVAVLINQSKVGGGSDSRHVVKEHEYIISFAKSLEKLSDFFQVHDENYLKRYKEEDAKGKFFWDTFARSGLKNPINYEIEAPDGIKIRGDWIRSQERFNKDLNDGEIRFIKKTSGEWSVQFKQRLNILGKKPRSLTSDIGGTIAGKNAIGSLFKNEKVFSYPKPPTLVKFLAYIIQHKDAQVLDFFAGSSTTAHAVMQLNAEDGGNRRFIMVQFPEACSEDLEAAKAGYKTIANISKERIRRAGQKILEGECHEGWNKDIGFRVLKVDDSNLNAVRQTPDATSQESLLDAVENIKPDRSEEDLLFDVMLRWGVDLAAPIERQKIDGKTVFRVNDNDLVACFDRSITEDFVNRLTEWKPLRVVFRDDAFASDDVKINTVQIFKQASPDTEVRSI